MLRSDLYPGLIVQISAPKVGTCLVKVLKVNPKNIKVVKENGERWNCSPSFLSPATPADAATFALAAPDEALTVGSVVKFKSPTRSSDLLVVLATRGGTFRLAKLGGDEGKYWSGISPSQVEVVKFDVAGL